MPHDAGEALTCLGDEYLDWHVSQCVSPIYCPGLIQELVREADTHLAELHLPHALLVFGDSLSALLLIAHGADLCGG